MENDSRGQIADIDDEGAVTVRLDGSGRTVMLDGEEREALRLGYAQRIYRQQGRSSARS